MAAKPDDDSSGSYEQAIAWSRATLPNRLATVAEERRARLAGPRVDLTPAPSRESLRTQVHDWIRAEVERGRIVLSDSGAAVVKRSAAAAVKVEDDRHATWAHLAAQKDEDDLDYLLALGDVQCTALEALGVELVDVGTAHSMVADDVLRLAALAKEGRAPAAVRDRAAALCADYDARTRHPAPMWQRALAGLMPLLPAMGDTPGEQLDEVLAMLTLMVPSGVPNVVREPTPERRKRAIAFLRRMREPKSGPKTSGWGNAARLVEALAGRKLMNFKEANAKRKPKRR